MHLTSSIDPSYKGENVAVVIFCFGQQRKFIRVSEDYQDTSRRVCRAFKVVEDAEILFQTSTFEVCKGKETVIDESAYPLMWNALDEVHVVIEESPAGQTRKPGSRQDVEPLPTPAETPTNGRSDNELDSFHRHSFLETPEDVEPEIPLGKGGKEERNDESAEESAHEEDHDDFYDPRETKQMKSLSDARMASGSKVHIKFKPAVASNAASSTSDANLTPQVKKEKMVQLAPSRLQEVPRQDQSSRTLTDGTDLPASDDPRFEIVITGPGNSSAHFKTRGKHPVRKVLAAACKTFGIKYDRAHLVLVLTFEEDDGLQNEYFVCPPEDTMSKCGVSSDSKLFIKIDEDENGNSD